MDLLKHLDEKLIAELIPEVSPRIIFMSYWKKNYSEKKESSTSSDTETNVGFVNKCFIHIVVLSEFNSNKVYFLNANYLKNYFI